MSREAMVVLPGTIQWQAKEIARLCGSERHHYGGEGGPDA